MKKTVYSFRDGLALTIAAAVIANINPQTKAADVVNPAVEPDKDGHILVKGVPYSEKPADGCWSEIEEYVPGPPEPDERDARIKEIEDGFRKFEEHHNKVVSSKNAELDALNANFATAVKRSADLEAENTALKDRIAAFEAASTDGKKESGKKA